MYEECIYDPESYRITREDLAKHIEMMRYLPDHYKYNIITHEFESHQDMVAYGIRAHFNDEVISIVVRYLDDKSHCYVEIPLVDNDYQSMLEDAFSEETEDALEKEWYRKNAPLFYKQIYGDT